MEGLKMIQSPHQEYDFKVQVRHQERDEHPSIARFFREIFWMTLNDFVNIIFIPSFPHEQENWSLNITTYVDDVRSLDEARQFTAALSDYTVIPDNSRAGQQEVYPKPPPLPPSRGVGPRTGVMFYVTQKEFTRFSQELALISEHTFELNEYIPFSEAKDFECMQLILDIIATSPDFSQEDTKILNLPWYTRRFAPHTVKMNKIERLVPREDKEQQVSRRAQEELALRSL